jgi:hypothetical protein
MVLEVAPVVHKHSREYGTAVPASPRCIEQAAAASLALRNLVRSYDRSRVSRIRATRPLYLVRVTER